MSGKCLEKPWATYNTLKTQATSKVVNVGLTFKVVDKIMKCQINYIRKNYKSEL